MSKIAEQKALEAYPIDIIPDDDTMGFTSSDRNEVIRLGYIKGYDQALKDMVRDAEKFQYLSDEVGFAYACGCKKTMQDFLEKAEMYLKTRVYYNMHPNNVTIIIQEFKNYMENEM